ncbi:hypothetical protein [Arthrobacter sp. UYEF3]|uniref:hypothetical protein n=1 Tax=Arthrobacter sp. UYEF3 TaxID=1756365 RepID=UPI00339A13E2
MSETPESNERRHSEAPAEGEDTDADETRSTGRIHSDEPAEGASEKDGTATPSQNDGPSQGTQDDEPEQDH